MKKKTEPAYLRISPVNINGKETNRLMIVLRTKGCEYARRTDGGCTVCGFLNHAVDDIVGEDIVKQLDYVMDTVDLSSVEEIDLLTLGSFFNENEVDEKTRRILLEKISGLEGIKRVSFESRAEYVSREKLMESKKLLGGKILEFGIGLESADDYIRNKIVKKGLSKKSFAQLLEKLSDTGCDLLTYLLIKPPHLSEKAAIEDAVKSVQYLFETGRQYGVRVRAAFEPVFICENTQLEDLFLDSKYRLVNLWSVVSIIRRVHDYCNIFVGLSDENLSSDRMPYSCSKCSKKLFNAIETFNRTQDASPFEQLDCECKKDYEYELERGLI
ncbi:MAG: archaeosine biosynthesis radical SAM protein RaSEA [bacterium]|nr:archaeosine biosynthesis radical SAM protein RaSEA [bacterium]